MSQPHRHCKTLAGGRAEQVLGEALVVVALDPEDSWNELLLVIDRKLAVV